MEYFSIKQTAELAGVSYHRLFHRIATGKLTPGIVGGRSMFSAEQLPAVVEFFKTCRPNRKRRKPESE